jgi:hypothetical protein
MTRTFFFSTGCAMDLSRSVSWHTYADAALRQVGLGTPDADTSFLPLTMPAVVPLGKYPLYMVSMAVAGVPKPADFARRCLS